MVNSIFPQPTLKKIFYLQIIIQNNINDKSLNKLILMIK